VRTLLVFALVGFGAQLVDGALGMVYGVTSTSLLLAAAVNAFVVGLWVAAVAVALSRLRGAPQEVAGARTTERPTDART
jgi:uncharacterized protein